MATENYPFPMSYAEYFELTPEGPGELIDGAYVVSPTPTPRHQHLVGYIFRMLGNHLEDHPEQGVVLVAPMDCVLRAERPGLALQPDVLFLSPEREHLIQQAVMGAPDLAVEVVSPSGARYDAIRKREYYRQFGVREYWLVWPEDERVDVITGDFAAARTLQAGDMLETPLVPGFALDVARLFAAGKRA
jgi:Uma2 family endonuclease